MDTPSSILRRVIQAHNEPLLRIEKATGVRRSLVRRFIQGKPITSYTLDKLARHYNLTLTILHDDAERQHKESPSNVENLQTPAEKAHS